MTQYGRICLDLETRSYADLGEVGVFNYSLHPSTEIICACWQIFDKDGNVEEARGEWDMTKGGDMPPTLRHAIMSAYTVEAQNYSFEYCLWLNVAHKRMGWVSIMPSQWRDVMAAGCYMAMPAALDQVSRALRRPGKNPEGTRLISKYSKLYLKTATRDIPPEDLRKFINYCHDDVTEQSIIGDVLGDLPARELPIFQLDQKINMRGLCLDVEGIAAATEIVEKRKEELTEAFRSITDLNPTQTAKVKDWCAVRGVTLDNMQADYLEGLIEEGLPAGPVREALTIRLRINKASLSKLSKMAAECGPDGRARWQCRYHGAQTGRWTGSGFQPLNLVRSWEDVDPEQLVRDVMYRSGAWLDAVYGDAMEAISKAGRHWIQAAPGHRIMAGDFVSIEAVILACVAGEGWKVEAFRSGAKIYELMGDKIHNLPPGTVTKKTHPSLRQDGKTCLGAGTKVLTRRGYITITEVTRTDELWDGVEWVTHSGLICQGNKETLNWRGVEITPDHAILCNGLWANAATVSSSEDMTLLALATASANLPSPASRSAPRGASSRFGSYVPAELVSDMIPAICGLSHGRSTPLTSARSANFKTASPILRPVYDITNAGPRRRFTILTASGPAIVHNCELAFGYQGGLGAWLNFDDSGRHSDERIHEIKDAWRGEHPMTVAFWDGIGRAALECVLSGKPTDFRNIGFEIVDDWLSMILLNGKRIWYREPQVKSGMPRWHSPETKEECRTGGCRCRPQAQLSYMAQKEGQWKRVHTYGGKLTENCVQAISREFLVPAMVEAEKHGYPIVLSVYDEIVSEVPNGHGSKKEFEDILRSAPGRDWCQGWPIGVDAWEGTRYKK